MTRVRARVCVFIIISPKCVDSWCLWRFVYIYIFYFFYFIHPWRTVKTPKHTSPSRVSETLLLASVYRMGLRSNSQRSLTRFCRYSPNCNRQCQTYIILYIKYVYDEYANFDLFHRIIYMLQQLNNV